MDEDTFERVRGILARHLEVPPEKIEPDSPLADLGLDSFAALEVIFDIEEAFSVRVPDERAAEFTTVRAICEGIETLRTPSPG